MIIPNVDNTGNLCEKENIRKWVYSVLKKKATTFLTLLYIIKVDICCFYVKMSIYLCSEKKTLQIIKNLRLFNFYFFLGPQHQDFILDIILIQSCECFISSACIVFHLNQSSK